MVKIFPIRIVVVNEKDLDRVWEWVNERIRDTKITQVTPLEMKRSQTGNLIEIKGLLEAHCMENISTSKFADILQPYPDFIDHIYFTYQ